MSHPILGLSDVHAAYLTKEILRGMSLTVDAGEIVAILGENGAGKSTTLKVVAGLLRPSKGRVHFEGQDLDGLDISQRQQRGVGYLMQGGRVFPNLTVQENHELAAVEARRAGRTPSLLGEWFPILRERRTVRAGLLSGGQRQMLAIEMVLTQQPRLLLLDEPTGALETSLGMKILTAIKQYVSKNRTGAVLVEQNADLALTFASTTKHLLQGKIDDNHQESNEPNH